MLSIDDRFELLALHRAVMEAKFHGSGENGDCLGSPYLASVANRTVDALTDAFPESNGLDKDSWERWRSAEQHVKPLEVASEYLRGLDADLSQEKKLNLVRVVLSPLKVREETAKSLALEISRDSSTT